MTTSGTYSYEATRNKIIDGALRIVGALGQGDTPTADQYSEASDALNMAVKALAAKGMALWAITEYSFVPIAAQTAYTIGPAPSDIELDAKPQKILQAWVRNTTSSTDTPLTLATKYDYNRIGNKTTPGRPSQLMYDTGNLQGTVYLSPTPDSICAANDRIFIVYQRTFQDFVAGADTPDFPQEWHEAIKYELAARLAFEYGLPTSDKKDLMAMARMITEEALSFGTEEGSIYFQRDN